jgi:hypothetical protein
MDVGADMTLGYPTVIPQLHYSVINKSLKVSYHPLRVTGLGLGVHLTRLRSLSLPLPASPSHPAVLPIASALLAAAVPIVDRSNSLFAAGVKFPSVLLGVQVGGPID